MQAFLASPSVQLMALLAWVVVLVFAVGRAERFLPKGSGVEAWIRHWAAVVQAIVVLGGLLAAIQILYGPETTMWRWLTLGVLGLTAWACRGALSDWASGLVLRAEGALRAGGRIVTPSGPGRIRGLGLRSAEVEGEDGRVLRLPYTNLAQASIEIDSEDAAARSHTFRVTVAQPVDAAAVSARMMTEALLSPWSSAQPAPSVRVLDHDEGSVHFEVTVYPVDAALVSKIEAAVRASVGTGTVG